MKLMNKKLHSPMQVVPSNLNPGSQSVHSLTLVLHDVQTFCVQSIEIRECDIDEERYCFIEYNSVICDTQQDIPKHAPLSESKNFSGLQAVH